MALEGSTPAIAAGGAGKPGQELQLSLRVASGRRKIPAPGRRQRAHRDPPRGIEGGAGRGRPRVRADGQSRWAALRGRLRGGPGDRRAQAGAAQGALVPRRVARRRAATVLRRRRVLHLRHGHRQADRNHQGRGHHVHRCGQRRQRDEAADGIAGLEQGRPVRAAQRRLGHLEGRGQGRRGGQPDGQRQEGQDPLPAALPPGSRRKGHRPGSAGLHRRVRRVDQEVRHRHDRTRQARRAHAAVGRRALRRAAQGEERRHLSVHARDREGVSRLLRRRQTRWTTGRR